MANGPSHKYGDALNTSVFVGRCASAVDQVGVAESVDALG